jgi:hypothetical protein
MPTKALIIALSSIAWAQYDTALIPTEKRSVMHVRQIETKCRIALNGETWVGALSAEGGRIRVRALGGERLLAVRGTLRYYFGNGTMQEARWRSEVIGQQGVPEFTVIPDPVVFAKGAPRVDRAEMRALGGYFESGALCGELGDTAKMAYLRGLDNAAADVEEALQMANALDEANFARAVNGNLVKLGPYARPSSPAMNNKFKELLLISPTRLVRDYKTRLQQMKETLKPGSRAAHGTLVRAPGF